MQSDLSSTSRFRLLRANIGLSLGLVTFAMLYYGGIPILDHAFPVSDIPDVIGIALLLVPAVLFIDYAFRIQAVIRLRQPKHPIAADIGRASILLVSAIALETAATKTDVVLRLADYRIPEAVTRGIFALPLVVAIAWLLALIYKNMDRVTVWLADIRMQPRPAIRQVPVSGQTCDSCGARIRAGIAFCTKCGVKLAVPADPSQPLSAATPASTTPPVEAVRYCANCATPLSASNRFCKSCGQKVREKDA